MESYHFLFLFFLLKNIIISLCYSQRETLINLLCALKWKVLFQRRGGERRWCSKWKGILKDLNTKWKLVSICFNNKKSIKKIIIIFKKFFFGMWDLKKKVLCLSFDLGICLGWLRGNLFIFFYIFCLAFLQSTKHHKITNIIQPTLCLALLEH